MAAETEDTARPDAGTDEQPCEDCAKADGKTLERAAGLLAIGFGLFLVLMGADLASGGKLGEWAGFGGG